MHARDVVRPRGAVRQGLFAAQIRSLTRVFKLAMVSRVAALSGNTSLIATFSIV